MTRKVMMGRLFWRMAAGLLLAFGLSGPVAGWPEIESPMSGQERTNAVDYLNLMGYEGIPVLGDTDLVAGPPPPIADWVTTHCRFIDTTGQNLQDTFLKYPLHLPDRANITSIQLRVADFAAIGSLWVYFRSRPWNSRAVADLEALVSSGALSQSDHTLTMSNVNLEVDNTTRAYWLDVSGAAADAAGELCVYSIHVAYTVYDIFADGFESGNTSAWSSTQ